MHNPYPTQIVRLTPLEGLRGIMAWWVVIGHLLYFFSDALGSFSNNRSAVDVFIIMSGFVITHLLYNKQEGYRRFIIRRWFRLFPAYGIILLLSAVTLDLQMAGLTSNPLNQLDNARYLLRVDIISESMANFWPHLLAHLTMLQGLVPDTVLNYPNLTFVGVAWSISLEWQFYLVYPLFVYLIFKRKFIWAILLSILLIGLRFTGLLAEGALPYSLHYFIVGIMSYHLWQQRHADLYIKLSTLILSGGLIAMFVLPVISVKLLALGLWCTILAMLLTMETNRKTLGLIYNPLQKLLEHPLCLYLGRISYSTYLSHMLVFYFVMWVLSFFHISILAWIFLLSVIGTSLGLVVSATLYKYVELPGIALGSKWLTYAVKAK